MTKEQLINALVDYGWEWIDMEWKILFKKLIGTTEVKYELTKEGLERLTPDQLDKKLKSHDVSQMTRIVGYYSKVHNWNRSKLGELRDRGRGKYVVTGKY